MFSRMRRRTFSAASADISSSISSAVKLSLCRGNGGNDGTGEGSAAYRSGISDAAMDAIDRVNLALLRPFAISTVVLSSEAGGD